MKEGYAVSTIEKVAYGPGDLAINIACTSIGFYFLFGCIPFGIMYMLIWLVPAHDHLMLFGYYTAIAILFNTAFTVVAVPYNALMPELSQNYDERTSISGYRMSLSFVGNLVAAVGVSLIVDVVFKGKEHYVTSYPVMGVFLGSIIIVLIFITFAGTKERVQSEAIIHEGLLKTFTAVLSLREFRILLGMFLFNMIVGILKIAL